MAKTPEFDLRENYGKNYIINGDMRISQRGTSFAAIANQAYSLDRWKYQKVGAMVHTATQDTDVPTLAQAGYLFQNSLRLNLTTPDTAIAAGDFCELSQLIEGYNWTNLAQKPFTLSFWVKATLTGTYCVSFRNGAGDRSYIAEYTISASNTWEKKTITVSASPSAGTWNYTNGLGLVVSFALASGTTFHTTANAWQTGVFISTVNQVNGVNTGATDFRIVGVQLNEGYEELPFRLFGGDREAEIQACQRYYEKSYNIDVNPGTIVLQGSRGTDVSGQAALQGSYVTRKRTSPTHTFWNPDTGTQGEVRYRNTLSAGGAGAVNAVPTQLSVGETAYVADGASQDNFFALWHFTADAEL